MGRDQIMTNTRKDLTEKMTEVYKKKIFFQWVACEGRLDGKDAIIA